MRKNIVNWPSMPFLRALPPLVAGVLFPDLMPLPYVVCLGASSLTIILAMPIMPLSLRYALRHLVSTAVLALIFTLGILLASLHDARNDPLWIGHQKPLQVIATIQADPVVNTKGVKLRLDVMFIRDRSWWKPAKGILSASSTSANYGEGDTLLITSAPSPLKSANTGYIRHMNRQNIYHIVKLRPGNHHILGKSRNSNKLANLRRRLFNMLDSLFPDQNEKAMAQALLTGFRGEMDPALLSAYTNTGVVHVIAVSGMHLALIYGMVSLLLQHLRSRRTKQVRILLILALLWVFALVCGASPSVVRSALMFSFILCADAFGQEQQPANTLAGSAFILICHTPPIIFDIGFQLSYAAVASLMLYSRPINRVFEPDNRLLAYGWTTVSTTLAAQILTTPLALVHFGQFPLLFLLSNIIAVPLSGLILILLILDCLLLPLGLSNWPALLTASLIRFMNRTITGLGTLEFATLRNIHINWYDAVNIYLVIMALTLWRRSKK